jgi:hypothetical protein
VENADLGHGYVGLQGLELLYGGDAQLAVALGNSIPHVYKAKIGVGRNKFIAYLAAIVAKPGGAFKVSGDVGGFAQQFSVDHLPIDPAARQKLHMFGLHTLGDLADLGIGCLQAQFGITGRLIWELVRGIDNRPLVPIQEEESVTESLSFPYEVTSMDVLLRTTEMLLQRLYGRPDMRGRFAAKARVECETVNSRTWSKSIQFREGLGDPKRAMIAMKSRLESDSPRDSFERVTVTLSDFTGEPSTQTGFLPEVRDATKDFAEVDRRIRVRTNGSPSLYRIVRLNPHHPLPEMRALQVPVDPAAGDYAKPVQVPDPVNVLEGDTIPRTLSIGRRRIDIAGVEETWKVNLWWLLPPLERVYFQLACRDGSAITIFRNQATGRWFRQNY